MLVRWAVMREGVESEAAEKGAKGLAGVRSGEPKDSVGQVELVGQLAGHAAVHPYGCFRWGSHTRVVRRESFGVFGQGAFLLRWDVRCQT